MDLLGGSVPDESTILAFRHLLGEKELAEKIFKVVNQRLEDQGLMMGQGTGVAATIINAPGSRKNKRREVEPEMRQAGKGKQCFYGVPPGYGMEAHIGVDKDSGLIHAVVNRAANVHDLAPASELLDGGEDVVYGDAGYQGLEGRGEMENKRAECRIAMRPGDRRQVSNGPEEQLQEWCEEPEPM